MEPTILYLVYIHGFRGDHTTFQSFPTDLHARLLPLLDPHIKLQSCLYPTYKSVRPISVATHNFLEWLRTQPPGHVILLGHSMGGLLAAEAATSPSSQSKRVIGMVAFDTPFLGMHPHVVISGIASLFPKDEAEPPKTEHELNHAGPVKMVDPRAVDDWDAYKASLKVPNSPHGSHMTLNSTISPKPSPTPSRSPSPILAIAPTPVADAINNFVDKTSSFMTKYSDDKIVKWFQKHSNEPFTAMYRWVVQHFEFGICMFDPSGLRDRYQVLEKWNGKWINYWTETVPCAPAKHVGESKPDGELPAANVDHALPPSTADFALLIENEGSGLLHPSISSTSSSSTSSLTPSDKDRQKAIKSAEKALKKQREREKRKEEPRPARHFITLPWSIGLAFAKFGDREKWEKVRIAGVEDEVAAHCGLFIKGQNVEYDVFVERVAKLILGWTRELKL